jgi:hypothetical protein
MRNCTVKSSAIECRRAYPHQMRSSTRGCSADAGRRRSPRGNIVFVAAVAFDLTEVAGHRLLLLPRQTPSAHGLDYLHQWTMIDRLDTIYLYIDNFRHTEVFVCRDQREFSIGFSGDGYPPSSPFSEYVRLLKANQPYLNREFLSC